MSLLAVIGVTALYLLYGWLLSAIIASWLSHKKGYGERIGLASGMLLSFVGVAIWVLVPSRPTSDWGRRKAQRRAGGDR